MSKQIVVSQTQAVLRHYSLRYVPPGPLQHCVSTFIDLLGSDEATRSIARTLSDTFGRFKRLLTLRRKAKEIEPLKVHKDKLVPPEEDALAYELHIKCKEEIPVNEMNGKISRECRWIMAVVDWLNANNHLKSIESSNGLISVPVDKTTVIPNLPLGDAHITIKYHTGMKEEEGAAFMTHSMTISSKQMTNFQILDWIWRMSAERCRKMQKTVPKRRTMFSLREAIDPYDNCKDTVNFHEVCALKPLDNPTAVWEGLLNSKKAFIREEIAKFKEGKNGNSFGVLLCGSPGTGKTTIAKLILAEFPERHVISMNDFNSIHDASVFRTLFEGESMCALKNGKLFVYNLAPSECILLFDEADRNHIFRARTAIKSVGTEAAPVEQVHVAKKPRLSQGSFNLQEWLEFTQGVVERDLITIACSNRPLTWFDPALRRKGRFGICIDTDETDERQRLSTP